MKKDLAASVRTRLLAIAKSQGVDLNQILVRFALERFLYRLGQSAYGHRFLLKGALLFTLWYDMPHRSTRDADLLGFGPSDLESITQTFQDIARIAVADGILFNAATIRVEEIRKEAGYPYKCRFFHVSPTGTGNGGLSGRMGPAGQGSGQPWPRGNGS